MHYYPHHIGDFIKDTANLTDSQTMAYLRMIWRYYLDESPIQGTEEDLAFAFRTDEKTVRLLLRHYFTETPEGWRHKRIDATISDWYAKSEKARQSANARWEKANAMRTHSERNANEGVSDATQYPIPNTQIKDKGAKAPRKSISCPQDVDKKVWADWLEIRKAKRLPLTDTAWEALLEECKKAGLTTEQMIKECCLRGWGAFKASWWKKEQMGQNVGERNAQVLQGLTRGLVGGGSNVKLLGS